MPKRSLEDYVIEVMEDADWLEASRIKDRVWEKMKGRSPSIREINAVLRRDSFIRMERDVLTGKVKRYKLKTPPKKNYQKKNC